MSSNNIVISKNGFFPTNYLLKSASNNIIFKSIFDYVVYYGVAIDNSSPEHPYAVLPNPSGSGSGGGAAVSYFIRPINVVANTPLLINHGLNLINKNSYVVDIIDSADRKISLTITSVDVDNILIESSISLSGLSIYIAGNTATNTYFITPINVIANTPLTIIHNLNLINKNAFEINIVDNLDRIISLTVESIDINSLTIESNTDLNGLSVFVQGKVI